MSNAPEARETVDQLLSPSRDTWTQKVATLRSGPAFNRLTRALPTAGGVLMSGAAMAVIADKIPQLLRLDLGVILVGGWKKLSELQRYTDRLKYGPDETMLVEITRHSVSSSHTPKLDLVLNGATVDTVPFDLKVTVTLDGVVLTIRDGRILAVSPGACKASVELKCEGFSLFKHEPAAVRLAAWTLKEPFDLRSGEPIVRIP